ncbi:MAG TPA: thiamine pyrophosphate-requiring protein [Streptosporangiaceae bacterium]|jgi:acetolactate synthase-1/2/3 large subunit|nr:thiamine pyrophosphate-requiring protein [Streptosporangiaceae bacterium]
MGDRYYSTSTAFLEALAAAGVRYMFTNLGSDHPGLIEALAQARVEGRRADLPEMIICPHETVALSAAHAYAAVTREPQAVLVHVDSGTQNLGGAVNTAFRGRVPVLIFAGGAPFTLEGELPGSRNEFIHWVQDVHDQRGILRNYVKYDNEIRTGRNVKQLVHRALQLSASEPAGPVYLVGPREVMEEQLEPYTVDAASYRPVEPAALSADVAAEIGQALARARRPLIVTGYLGRHPEAVSELEALCDLLAIPVIESAPHYVNFPASHPMHNGYQWTTKDQNPVLAEADVVLAIDCDVPWIQVTSKPAADAEIYCVDIDPLKSGMAMWHIPARRFAAADSRLALPQITAYVRDHHLVDEALVGERRADVTGRHDMLRAERDQREVPDQGVITPQYLAACVRDALADDNPLFLSEAITNYEIVAEHLRVNRPGGLIGSGGGSLGWAGGGAVGAKLAAPDRTVVCLVGDGSYLFGVPSSAQWVARKYNTPALTVIFNNRGWRAPKFSALAVHPKGAAAENDDFNVSFEPAPDYPAIAEAAGGAYAANVSDPADLPRVLREALAEVHGGRSAVVAAYLPGV